MTKQQDTRYIYVKDKDASGHDFKTHEEALAWQRANKLVDSEERRVRIRLRNRTNTYDVVVKLRKEAPKKEATA